MGADFAATVLGGSLPAAFGVCIVAGLVAFLSPCVLPVVPGYLGYITGLTGQDLDRHQRGRMLAGAALFILGFTLVFLLVGGFAGAIGAFLARYVSIVNRVAGVLVILMGLLFLGAFPQLMGEKRSSKRPDGGLAGAPLLGMTFALSWTPCMGPTLAAVIALSLNEGSAPRGAFLALGYCLGLGIPFLLFALLLRNALGISRVITRHARAISVIGGIALIAVGLALVTGVWEAWMGQLQTRFGDVTTVV